MTAQIRFSFLKSKSALKAFGIGMLLSIAPLLQPTAQAETEPLIVAELFTSQGCSSCPAADKLLQSLATDANVLALSIHVDYWDYLGWKDKLARPEFSDRQRNYARYRGDRMVYTPQMIINGNQHVVGNNEGEVEAAIRNAPAMTAQVDIQRTHMGIKVVVTGELPKGYEIATIVLASIQDEETVTIERGENAGRKVTYANVVNDIQPIGLWSGGSAKFSMPKSELMRLHSDKCAILVQLERDEGPGRIIGANALRWKQES
ncbi:MAG: DUF1223 domain-containing protein [Rhodobacteraceae bacterium]|nr:DUF1223 domain-containing protein [Paracoccaceae bacterium]